MQRPRILNKLSLSNRIQIAFFICRKYCRTIILGSVLLRKELLWNKINLYWNILHIMLFQPSTCPLIDGIIHSSSAFYSVYVCNGKFCLKRLILWKESFKNYRVIENKQNIIFGRFAITLISTENVYILCSLYIDSIRNR